MLYIYDKYVRISSIFNISFVKEYGKEILPGHGCSLQETSSSNKPTHLLPPYCRPSQLLILNAVPPPQDSLHLPSVQEPHTPLTYVNLD